MLQQQHPYATSTQFAKPELSRSLENTVSNLRALESCIDTLRNDLAVVAQSTGNFEAVQALATPALRSPIQGQIPNAAFAQQANLAGIQDPYQTQLSPLAQQAAYAPYQQSAAISPYAQQAAFAPQAAATLPDMQQTAFAPQLSNVPSAANRSAAWAPNASWANAPLVHPAAFSPFAPAASSPWAQQTVPQIAQAQVPNLDAQLRQQALSRQIAQSQAFAPQHANIANRQAVPSVAPASTIGPF